MPPCLQGDLDAAINARARATGARVFDCEICFTLCLQQTTDLESALQHSVPAAYPGLPHGMCYP